MDRVQISPYPIEFGLSIIELPKGSKVVGAGKRKNWHLVSKDYFDRGSLCIYVLHKVGESEKERRNTLTTRIDGGISSDFDSDVLHLVSGNGSYHQISGKHQVFVGPPNDKLQKFKSETFKELVGLENR